MKLRVERVWRLLAMASLLLATGCHPAPSASAPSPGPSIAPRVAASPAPSTAPSVAASPEILVDTRLFGRVPFTARPRNIFDPLEAKRPHYEKDEFSWNPQETFETWVDTFDKGTMAFGVSIHEADGLYPSLKGATVADVGAGYGNNLYVWRDMLGPEGRLVETEVDINASRFMAYAANKAGYGRNTMIVNNVYENPDLPVGRFDLVLCSQLHYHLTVGKDPRGPENDRKFYAQSAVFLGAIRAALKDDTSRLVIVEGIQPRRDPRQLLLSPEEATANIVRNGFRVVDSRVTARMWTAAFTKAP